MLHTHTPDADRNSYHLDQLCMIGVCAALGAVSIQLYAQGSLIILAPIFQTAMLIGGIGLLVLSALRGMTLWLYDGKRRDAHHSYPAVVNDHTHQHGHAHEHGPDCGHGHANGHEHGQGHDHDHGWAPVRYAVLLLPITLFFLQIPNQAFNNYYNDYGIMRAQGDLPPLLAVWFFGVSLPEKKPILDNTDMVKIDSQEGEVLNLGFTELEQAAYTPARRAYYQGKTGILKGQFTRLSSDKVFTLARLKMTCCRADAVLVKVAIVSPEPITDIEELKWVEVTGQIQFRKPRPDREDYVPVLQLAGRSGINTQVQADNNLFVY